MIGRRYCHDCHRQYWGDVRVVKGDKVVSVSSSVYGDAVVVPCLLCSAQTYKDLLCGSCHAENNACSGCLALFFSDADWERVV